MLITVTPSARNPYFNMVQIGVDSSVKLASEGRYHRRQDAPQIFDISTVAYVAKPEFILKSSYIFDGNIRAVSIPNERAIDIDNNIDFALAELISLNIKNTSPATLLVQCRPINVHLIIYPSHIAYSSRLLRLVGFNYIPCGKAWLQGVQLLTLVVAGRQLLAFQNLGFQICGLDIEDSYRIVIIIML